MKLTATLLIILMLSARVNAQLTYPVTKKVDQKDNYFGIEVADPYRWLEDDKSADTKAWVTEQNKVTNDYLSKIPFRQAVKNRLTQLWNFPKSSTPFKAGKNYLVYTNNGLQNQFVLNILRGGYQSAPVVFVDPNKLSSDGTANMSTVSPSHDGKYIAYAVSKAGSDWEDIMIKDSDGKDLPDKIEWVKFSGISWFKDGFYYSRYDKPDESGVLKGKNEFHKIYYHKVGTQQSQDSLVYVDKDHPLRNFGAGVTDDEDYLFITGSEGTSGNNLMALNLKSAKAQLVTLVNKFDKDYSVIDNDGSKIYVHTNDGASNYKLIMMNADDASASWVDVIPEDKNVLQEIVVSNNQFVARYMKDATSILKIFSKDGKFIREIPLESIGTVEQLSASKKSKDFFYALTTFVSPAVIYHYDMSSDKQDVFFQPKMEFDSKNYVTEEVFYTSKDGTKVPMFIVHKKDYVRNGNSPVLLFGYGGFNVSKTPEFKIERLVFLENGGVFAAPCIRGGGEYGEDWHQAGTGLKKQNVFDDFIAAAEYLIKEKYTNSQLIAINGRSNGGLLVGACMTQRPDLFKVAIPTVGVMDMLRYHKFTIGWAWKGDYGSSDDEANFKNLLSYSPLHNIKAAEYPATLVTTGDHDDRVVPAHSFKFISTLQEKQKGKNPVLIRIDVNAGHAAATALGSSKPVSKQIEEMTDIFSFIMYNLGMKVQVAGSR
jgi:prolyl oligopeptidase